jgi:hypothetical protein
MFDSSLPTIPTPPFTQPDQDIQLDLQPLIDTIYEGNDYRFCANSADQVVADLPKRSRTRRRKRLKLVMPNAPQVRNAARG